LATLTYLLRLYLPWQECYTSSVFDVPAVTAKAFKPVPEVGPIARRCVLGEATLHIPISEAQVAQSLTYVPYLLTYLPHVLTRLLAYSLTHLLTYLQVAQYDLVEEQLVRHGRFLYYQARLLHLLHLAVYLLPGAYYTHHGRFLYYREAALALLTTRSPLYLPLPLPQLSFSPLRSCV